MIRARLRFAHDVFPAPNPIREWIHFWDYLDSQRAALGKPLVPRPNGHNPDKHAYARVDDGRWIADCPWGCGSAFNLPENASWMWCTECAGGGWGLTAALTWPAALVKLAGNLESLPVMLQYWPCTGCAPRLAAGSQLCDTCRGMQGEAV
ncbi:hypothetical protein ACFWYW_55900 [Nonomuraea sp. NPDC059023]|uniref:hypothetical protein n=1 Tax=unclassified Nonomuraea TaxID=2593643 RepID=UPI0036C009F1